MVITVILEDIKWSVGVLRLHSVQNKIIFHRFRLRLMGKILKEGKLTNTSILYTITRVKIGPRTA